MIFFCNKNTGDVVGVISGRVHDPIIVESAWIQPNNVAREDIVKFVLPYIVLPGGEYVPDVLYKDLIYAFEELRESVYNYKAIFDNEGNVSNFEKKV